MNNICLSLILFCLLLIGCSETPPATANKKEPPQYHLCTIMGPERPTDSLIGDASFLWKKKIVSVYFMDDDGNMRDRIIHLANSWRPHTGITFVRSLTDNNSDIRISFRTNGWWSFIGTASSQVGKDSVTMSLDSVYLYDDAKIKSVVLHEFGHAIGLIHEHQHSGLEIPWDKPALYKYYDDTYDVSPGWVDTNVIQKYGSPTAIYCEPDTNSIMIYEIPDSVTIGAFEVLEPLDLSALDKKYINYMYTGKNCKTYSFN